MFVNKNQIKIIIQLCLVLGISLILSSCSISDSCGSCQDEEAMETFSYAYLAEGLTEFELSGVNGSIEIIGVAGQDSIEIWGERIVRSDTRSDAEQHLELLQVNIQTGISRLSVETQQPSQSNGRNYEINYYVRVPESLKISVESVNGSILIHQIVNDVLSDLVNGNIELQNIQGSCQAAVVNGQIDTEMTFAGQDICVLSTVNGNIRLTIPKATSARIIASVVNGSISFAGLQLQDLVTTKTTASGVMGDGSGTIQLQTVNGSIEVRGE